MSQTITISVPDETTAALRRLATQQGVSLGELASRALSDFAGLQGSTQATGADIVNKDGILVVRCEAVSDLSDAVRRHRSERATRLFHSA